MNRFNKHPFKAKLILTLIVIFLVFILLFFTEMTIGYFTYINKRFIRLRENPPYMDLKTYLDKNIIKQKINKYLYNNDKIKKEKLENIKPKKYRIRTDENGFIKPGKIHNNADLTIFFVGGSTTQCGIVDEKNRFPYLAGHILEEKIGLKINSFNSGVPGNHSFHTIDILLNKILPYKPQIVVFMHNANDLDILIPYGTYWNNNPYKSLITYFNDSRNKKKENANTIFPVLCERTHNIYIKLLKYWKPSYRYSELAGEKILVNQNDIISQYRKALKTFVCICKIWDIEPVLMTQKISLEQNSTNLITEMPDSFEYIMPKSLCDSAILNGLRFFHITFNNIIRDVAKEEEITLIDLERAIPADDSKYIYDIFHYNDSGSVYVAKIK